MIHPGRRQTLLFPVALVVGSLLRGKRARATQPVSVEVRVILAKKTVTPSTDSRLAELPQLKAAPFDRYNHFEQIGHEALSLSEAKGAEYILPNRRTITLSLLGDHEVNRDAHGRYRLRVQIGELGQKDYLKNLEVSASAHEPFFVAGQAYGGGVLVLAITIIS